MKTTLIALGAAMTLAATTAGAATVTNTTTFDFTGESFYNLASRSFTSSDGNLTVDVSAFYGKYVDQGYKWFHTGISNTTDYGLNIKNSDGDDHRIDGYVKDEFVKFSFGDAIVTLTNVLLNPDQTEAGSRLFYSPGGATTEVAAETNTAINAGASSVFYVGTFDDHSAFKIRGITVSYDVEVEDNSGVVPLPAGAPLLLGALGLVGLAKRRRKAA